MIKQNVNKISTFWVLDSSNGNKNVQSYKKGLKFDIIIFLQ